MSNFFGSIAGDAKDVLSSAGQYLTNSVHNAASWVSGTFQQGTVPVGNSVPGQNPPPQLPRLQSLGGAGATQQARSQAGQAATTQGRTLFGTSTGTLVVVGSVLAVTVGAFLLLRKG